MPSIFPRLAAGAAGAAVAGSMLLLAACSARLPDSAGRAGSATAADLQPPAQLGLCAACHGSDGIARQPGVPNLAGQPAGYLLKAMHEYRDGTRDAALMRGALGPISAQQLQALAAWYAAQPACPPRAARR